MLSIVVPLYDEELSVPPLVAAVSAAMAGFTEDWELILVDDGSRDGTVEVALRASAEDPRVRVIPLARNYGQSTAMQAGFDHARGAAVVSMDGDLQNDPLDIPRLLSKLEEGFDLVSGYRERRQDKLLTRRIPSWIANRVIRRLTGVPIRDNGCSLKAYRKDVLDRVKLYSDMHRFIPTLAAAMAGARITEIPVRHHARRFGSSKYGLSRILKVLGDLLTIKLIRSFRERPLRLFAPAALGAFAIAALPLAASAAVVAGWWQGSLVVLFGIALCWLGLATFLAMLGLLAESVLSSQHEPEPTNRIILRERAS